jgi:hypothetical protein
MVSLWSMNSRLNVTGDLVREFNPQVSGFALLLHFGRQLLFY